MDDKPFFEINIDKIKENDIKELKKFTKPSFDLEKILNSASELKYTKEIKKIIEDQYNNPSDEFAKFFAKQVYSGVLTKNIREQFVDITKIAFKQFIKEEIDGRLSEVLNGNNESDPTEEIELNNEKKKVITTDEELEGFYIVKAIIHEITDPKRVFIRDRMSYCGILLDNTQLKPICRLHFNTKQKYLGIFDEQKHESRIPIEDVSDIYKYADTLKETVNKYDGK